ncbi:MAG: RNase J family beta-CASP ribonuclease, partial [Oscillospiraceae bacterium]|nr:RNase J family beta-CASP ribonuclease [Oscillospiraceae bacterium]
DGDSMKFKETVQAGKVFVDGIGIGDVGNIVLRDRKHLAEDGLIIVVAAINSQSHALVSGPDIISRGFVYVRESEELMDRAKIIIKNTLEAKLDDGYIDWPSIKSSVREALASYVYQKTKRNPMILPIIINV